MRSKPRIPEYSPWGFGDVNCGLYATCGNPLPQLLSTNYRTKIANGSALGASVNKALTGVHSMTRSLPEPFSGGAVTTAASNITINHNSSPDDLSRKFYQDVPISVKMGGLMAKGTPNQELLSYEDYALSFEGKVVDYDSDEETTDLTIGLKSTALTLKFPPNTYDGGDSEGLTIPKMYGRVYGFSPLPIKDGLKQWHDGDCDVSDVVLDRADFVAFSEGFSYTARPLYFSAPPSGSAIVPTDFEWVSETDQLVTWVGNSIRVPDGFAITPSGNLLTVGLSDDSPPRQQLRTTPAHMESRKLNRHQCR